ncbi:MAG: glycosyltransferase [bacterium]
MRTAVIVLPTYNEASSIEKVIHGIFAQQEHLTNWELSVLVVDSDSPDKTGDIVTTLAQKSYPRLHLLKSKKEGLGKAYLTGFAAAIKDLGAEVLFEMDSDFSHDPAEIPHYLREIDRGADMVVGTRYSKGGSIPANWGLDRKIYSIGANMVIRLGFMRMKNTEWTNGYRAITSKLVLQIVPAMGSYTGYVFQVAFLDKAMLAGAKIVEIPIQFTDRVYGESKINAKQYAFQTFAYVFNNSSFIKYLIVGVTGAIVDIGGMRFLWKVVGLDVLLANRISMELAVITNFLLNNFWAFSHKRVKGGVPAYLKSFLQFNLIAIGSFIIQEGCIRLGISLFGVEHATLYKVLTIGFVIIPYSYILYNKVIWKKN